jgi:uncharacterized protein YjiS (DUF1127 family)
MAPTVDRIIKSIRMRLVRNVAAWKERERHSKFWTEHMKDRDLEDLGTERKLLK